MHPNMRKLLGLDTPPVFHKQTWPVPVDVPADAGKKEKSQ